ncbi:hypothetical protein O988_02669 [Pseudogymnoascus sp. VKM F-3808]|nr:hypothetical protein O988_02669 [Pseudogymnoascus sp. VKM F-3808]
MAASEFLSLRPGTDTTRDIDWRSESALMNSVYSGSTITIAAVGASDGTKGCFLKSPGFISKIHIEPTIDEVWDIAPIRFYKSVSKSPLADRAWAVQERFLSPRTLHFSKTGLFWECRHYDASESFPEGSPAFENQHVFHRDRKPSRHPEGGYPLGLQRTDYGTGSASGNENLRRLTPLTPLTLALPHN